MTGFSELVDRFLLAYPTKYTPQGFRAKGCGNPSVGTPEQHYLIWMGRIEELQPALAVVTFSVKLLLM